MSVFYDFVRSNELPRAHEIEVAGYPADEAASLEAFQYRQANAPDLFLGAYLPADTGRTLIGYVCATQSSADALTHESMSNHVPGAPSVCIHSVCIDLAHRRRGIALGLLKEYTRRLGAAGTYDRILLIAHEELRELYERAGFEWVGRSAVVHGARPWYEMRRVLKPAPEPAVPPQQPGTVPAGLWEALQRASGARARPQALAITAFPNGAQDLVANDGKGTLANKFDLLCPREGCGSVILKNGVASLVERASVQLDPPQRAAGSPLAPLPTPPSTMNWWLVTPNAMVFENIGFTRAVVPEEGKRIKLLICAECDLGPLGWCEEGGSEFWLATSRVGYRQ